MMTEVVRFVSVNSLLGSHLVITNPRIEEVVDGLFSMIDIDGDGFLTHAEFKTARISRKILPILISVH